MRLTPEEIDAIKETFTEVFKEGEIYLFGSRVDDALRGGDIDLYIQTPPVEDLAEKKVDFLVKLKRRIGERKIDVVIARDETRPIERAALESGVKL